MADLTTRVAMLFSRYGWFCRYKAKWRNENSKIKRPALRQKCNANAH